MKNETVKSIIDEKLIVIIRAVEREKLLPLAKALYDGGIRLLELTFSADGRISDEEIAAGIAMLAKEFDGRIKIGAGTVLNCRQVELAEAAGAKYIISPDTNAQVIARTVELGMVSIPGALTPTEIQAAHVAGADFVKLFPVTSFGAEYVKAVGAPLSHVKLLAVGGIDESNMADYYAAGACGFGVGGCIINKKMIAKGDFEGITALAKKYTEEIASWKNI